MIRNKFTANRKDSLSPIPRETQGFVITPLDINDTYNSDAFKTEIKNEPYYQEEVVPPGIRIEDNTGLQYLRMILEEQNKTNAKLHSIENELRHLKQKMAEREATYEADLAILRRNLAISERLLMKVNAAFPTSGDDESVVIEKLLPIASIPQLHDFEMRLQDPHFCALTEMYLRKTKGSSSLNSMFRRIATDNVYSEYNLDGRAGKKSLNSLIMFHKILFESCAAEMGRPAYEKEIRREVGLAHNRFHKSNALNKNRQSYTMYTA